eukprot:TRINITY_DN6190_c0_g1_i1.p1 TRINITY_DN6190_c0_g1~~TRINITY_DN6190_c0_g1_i1.p1  ORF type:complete len:197 (+),score=48.36 TRINITY_DN6190_c0_g1_i1:131-721(+)
MTKIYYSLSCSKTSKMLWSNELNLVEGQHHQILKCLPFSAGGDDDDEEEEYGRSSERGNRRHKSSKRSSSSKKGHRSGEGTKSSSSSSSSSRYSSKSSSSRRQEKEDSEALDVCSWDVDTVATWLISLDESFQEKYVKIFRDQNIDGSLLIELDDDLVKDDLKVSNDTHRSKILQSIKDLREPKKKKKSKLKSKSP